MISIQVGISDLPDVLPQSALGEVRGRIAFPANYAQYHQDVLAGSFERRREAIGHSFRNFYQRSLNLERSVEAVTREHLSEMRSHELDAPAAGPPARNPFTDRLRRITGQLADTAFVRVERVR